MTQRVLVLFGGASAEHEVSLRSAVTVLQAMDRSRFTPVLVGIGRDHRMHRGPDVASQLLTVTDLEAIVREGPVIASFTDLRPDIVFPVLHGPNGEDGTIQGACTFMGVPYVGSGVLASAVCMDKAMQRWVVTCAAPEVPLVAWTMVDGQSFNDADDAWLTAETVASSIGFPCFVKPSRLGSSVGISKARNMQELAAALVTARMHDSRILVEKAVRAREIEVAVLGNGHADTLVSLPGEIVLPEGIWYDYDTKYISDVATLHVPAELDLVATERIRHAARLAFEACDCRGLARIDFFLDRDSGQPYLNELNTMPGFTSASMYPKLMATMGIDATELITRLIELGFEDHATRVSLLTTP